ncbi:MAG: hypothetical protein KGZ25_16315 [Planctomycetes bacterium]|nr:hypothetical protein [Planctomycetota bacterium]
MTLAQRQGSDNCPYSFIWGFSWRHAAPPFQITAPGSRRVMMTDFTFDAPSQGFTCYAHPKDSPQEKMVARDFGANYNTAYQFFQDDSASIGGRGMEAVGGTHVLFFDGSVAWYKPDDLEPWWGHGGATMVPSDGTYGPP